MTVGPAFSTVPEALAVLAVLRDVLERLPVAGGDLVPALGPVLALPGAIQSLPLVDPVDAVGTHRYREVHGLPPITEET